MMDEGKKVLRERDRAEILAIMSSVRRIRRLMDFSVTDFAAFCSLSFKAYYMAEYSGSCSAMSLLHILRALSSLDVSVERLISGEEFDASLVTSKMLETASSHRVTRLNHNQKSKFNEDFYSRLV